MSGWKIRKEGVLSMSISEICYGDFWLRSSWQEQLSQINVRPANFKCEQNTAAAEAAQF